MNHCVVYQAYGQAYILKELIYSVYTLIKQYDNNEPPFKIIIYTDNIPYLQKYLPRYVEYVEVNKALLDQWSGTDKFVHRIKVEMLIDVFKKYECSVIYLDTDTSFLSRIDDLFAYIDSGKFVMHKKEGLISSGKNLIFKKLKRILSSEVLQRKTLLPSRTYMYNAGVLGIPYSSKEVLKEVLQQTDILYGYAKNHCMEQLAFSYQLIKNSQAEILEAEPYIFHYWNFKEFRKVLDNFFDHYTNTDYQILTNKINLIDPTQLIKPKMAYENSGFFLKAIKKLKKKRWSIPSYILD